MAHKLYKSYDAEEDFSIKINSLLIFLLFISLPLREHWSSKALILILIYTLLLLFRKKKISGISKYKVFLFLFLASALSLTWSIDISNSLILLKRLLPILLIPLWGIFLHKNIKYVKIFKYLGVVYVILSIYTIYLGVLRYNLTHNIEEFFYHTLVFPMDANAIYSALFYLFVYVFNLYYVLYFKENRGFFNYILLSVLFIYIVLLSSKMITILTILSTAVLCFLKLSHYIQNKTIIRYSAISFFFLSFVLILNTSEVLNKRFKNILNLQQLEDVFQKKDFGHVYLWNGLGLRALQLRSFWDIEKDKDFNSFLGVGLNNGQIPLNERYIYYNLYQGKKGEKDKGFLEYNFHNQYAQSLIELGIFGGIVLFFVFLSLFKEALKTKNILLFLVLVIFMFLFATESLLNRHKGIIVFVLLPIIAIRGYRNLQIKV
jgi:hypothetical protein